MRLRVRFAALLSVLLLVTTGVLPAYAADTRSGYRECNSGRQLRVTSNTGHSSGAPFFVRHEVGSKYKTYTLAVGVNVWHSGLPGGTWQVITNGVIYSVGISCV